MIAFYVFLAILFFCVGISIGYEIGCNLTQEDAIKHGAGEFYLDTKYKKQFRWKSL